MRLGQCGDNGYTINIIIYLFEVLIPSIDVGVDSVRIDFGLFSQSINGQAAGKFIFY